MSISLQIAGVMGPILVALSISEYFHYKIWKDVHATVVYLNGLVLLTCGLIVVRLHNIWVADWTVLITILGWLLVLMGLGRMFFPTNKQLEKGLAANILLLLLLLLGIFLSMKAYFL